MIPMKLNLGIQSLHFETPLGNTLSALYEHYTSGIPAFSFDPVHQLLTSPFPYSNEEIHKVLGSPLRALSFADRSTLLTLLALKNIDTAALADGLRSMISIGSSRGASGLIEQSVEYLQQNGKVQAYSSPMTTLGNIASFVAQTLGLEGFQVEHSMTCSTSSQSILNAAAWINSGMADRVIAGAVDTPLTPHNLAQMKALKIYSKATENTNYPVRSLDLDKTSSGLILGEAAITAVLEKVNEHSKIRILSAGFATEPQKHPVAVDSEGIGLQNSMRMALKSAGLGSVDVIICHATGTMEGDKAEVRAIDHVFDKRPLITSTKWLTGHTFGASGMHGILLAALMFGKQEFITAPFLSDPHIIKTPIRNIMINTLGFGGQAVSLVLEKI